MRKALLFLALLTSLSRADVIGGELNLGYYNHTPTGTAQFQGDVLKLEDTLKWESEGDMFIKAYLEHPLPIIPNIKIGYSDFSHAGEGSVNKSFTFGGETFNTDRKIETKFDLKMYDLTLYYELLDNWINIDAGVNIKYIDGELSVKSGSREKSTDFQVPVPMLYGKVRLDIPATDLSFQVEGNYITYNKNTFYDAEIGARYTLALGLGIEAGYKTMKLDIQEIDDLSMESDFSGAYGKLVWDF